MQKFVLPFAAASLALVGCATTHESVVSAPMRPVVESKIQANIKVGDTIMGESQTVTLLGLFNFGSSEYADGVEYPATNRLSGTVETTKSAAAYKAVKRSGSDLLVAPRYEVVERSYLLFRTTDVTVVGRKGTIQSIESTK